MSEPADPASAKGQLRRRLLAARRALSAEELDHARAAVRSHLLHRLDLDGAAGRPWQRIFAYEAMATEPASRALLADLTARGASVYVPVLLADNDLDWTRWRDSALLGLEAVSSASVVLVPALAVDRSGLRMGRGGGSYDRVLSRVRADVPVVALLHRGEILDHVPAEAWDRRVTAVVTPEGWCELPTG